MKMSLIVLSALAASFLLRRRSAALRHWVLAAGIACAAALPILSAAVPAWPLPFATPTAFTRYEDPFRDAQSPSPTRPSGAVNGATVAAPVPPGTALRPGFDLGAALQSIWLAGTFVGLAILLTGVLRLAWLAVHAHRVTHGRWYDLAGEISRGYGLRRPVTLLQSSHPSLLVTWGLARPKVILPSAADAWTEERARVVLSHELAHIHRGDWIVQLAAELLRAFYWFNPLLWVACRRLRLESEHACDDEVMRRGFDGTNYATHLIELARALNQRRPLWFPAPAMARPSSLERRVRAMLNDRLERGSISGGTRAAILMVLLGLTTAVAAAQSGFVTFSGRVADEQGRGVQSVAVALVNEARQAKYEVKTNANGRFEFVGLPAGEYSVEAQSSGFQSFKDDLTVAGQNLERNYTLKIGTLQETVTLGFSARDETNEALRDTPVVGQSITPKKWECVIASPGGGYILPPKKIRDAHPYYPSALRGVWTAGTVKMEARIGVDGYVADVRIVGDAQPDLAQSAVAAVREWRYTETMLNCTPVEVMMNVTVNFERRQ
jgi:beta-lactamase regulating signal transducer with metallopeptidase domain